MKSFLIIIFSLLAYNGIAQLDMVGELVRGGVNDGEKLMKAYLFPYEKALGYTAVDSRNIYMDSIHNKTLRWAVGFQVNSIFIPESDLSFDINSLQLERMEAANSAIHISPTLFGDTNGIAMKSKDEFNPPFKPSQAVATFNTPQGIGFPILPIPEVQLASSYKNTQIMVSGYYAHIKNVLLIGYNVSVNSQLTSYFNVSRKWPIQIEGEFTFGGSSQTANLDVQPDAAFEVMAKGPYDNQKFMLNLNGFSLGLGANYSFYDFRFFAKAYYQNFSSRTQVIGNYPVNVKDPSGTFGVNVQDVVDPIDYSRTYSGMKLNFGTQYNIFSFLYIKASYSISSYNNFTFGIGYKR